MKYLCWHQRATLGRVTCQCTEPVMTSQSTELLTTPPSQLWREGENILNSSLLKYYIYTILLFSIPGVPGEDYPIYAEVPETAFSCSGQVDGGESEYFLHLKYFHYWVWNISHSEGESLSLSEYFYFVAKKCFLHSIPSAMQWSARTQHGGQSRGSGCLYWCLSIYMRESKGFSKDSRFNTILETKLQSLEFRTQLF